MAVRNPLRKLLGGELNFQAAPFFGPHSRRSLRVIMECVSCDVYNKRKRRLEVP
jgi:hypothetical protein